MRVIEKLIRSKTSSQAACEDRIVITENFVCVIDGATSKVDRLIDKMTIGQFASEIIERTILGFEPDIGYQNAIILCTENLKSHYLKHNLFHLFLEAPWERPSASIALYSKFHNQVWLVGDCQCIANGTFINNPKKIDNILSKTRALYLENELLSGMTIPELQLNDTGREYILPLLKKQQLFQNNGNKSEYSYSVIDGFEIDFSRIHVIDIIESEIVLATDGYPIIFDNLTQTESYLSDTLIRDPLMFRIHKMTKGSVKGQISYDDRAYVKIQCEKNSKTD